MQKLIEAFIIVIGFVFVVSVVALIITLPLYLLWNDLKDTLHLPAITLVQSFEMIWLSTILFKSIPLQSSKKEEK